jgi:hypothetical protein
MTRTFLPAAAILATLASGVAHGLWTHRWTSTQDVAAAAARLPQLPLTLGDWQGQEMDFDTRQVGPVAGYLYRRYVNQRTGVAVTLSLAFGPSGPVSIHTPDVCYVASGFEAASISKFTPTLDASQPAAEFQTAQFIRTRTAERKYLRVFWSWNAGGVWQVASYPRLAFAPRYPVLYKLHLVREMAAPDEPLEDDPCVEFMQRLLPELQRSVMATS